MRHKNAAPLIADLKRAAANAAASGNRVRGMRLSYLAEAMERAAEDDAQGRRLALLDAWWMRRAERRAET
jgi:hypothetical protein